MAKELNTVEQSSPIAQVVATLVSANKVRKASSTKVVKEERFAKLGALACEIGEQMGMADSDMKHTKHAVNLFVENTLREMMKLGLSCDKESPSGDMLKKGTELNVILIDAVRATSDIGEGTLANYVSRMRKFVRGESASLDLYGNIAAQAAKEKQVSFNTKTAQDGPQGENEGSEDAGYAESDYVGATAVLMHLQRIADANPIEHASVAYQLPLKMLADCQAAFESFVMAQNKAKGAKAK